jgi:hypothetical protein
MILQLSNSPPSMTFKMKPTQSSMKKRIMPENTISDEPRRTQCIKHTAGVIMSWGRWTHSASLTSMYEHSQPNENRDGSLVHKLLTVSVNGADGRFSACCWSEETTTMHMRKHTQHDDTAKHEMAYQHTSNLNFLALKTYMLYGIPMYRTWHILKSVHNTYTTTSYAHWDIGKSSGTSVASATNWIH